VLLQLLLSSQLTYEVEETFTVVGITDSGVIPKYSYIPYETAAKIAEESAKATSFFQEGAEIVVADQADYSKVVKEIEDLGYQASTNQGDFEEINTLVMGLKIFLIFIAAVALLVSGIMIKIVLHTNVVERTREIGIMCAIGAGRKDVKRIFVAEAGILGMLAGVMGVILGQSLGAVLNVTLHSSFQGMNFNLYMMNVKTVLFCIMISVIIAVLAGRKPARKAAGIDPAIALRYE
jgi:ABC-type antimicrobial peptide transport system permease subunit